MKTWEAWLGSVEVFGTDDFYDEDVSTDGTFFDNTSKPRQDIGYDVEAHLYCSDSDGNADYNLDFWLSGGAGVALQPIIQKVALWDTNFTDPVFYPVPETYCNITGEEQGFTAAPWYEVFGVNDAWDQPDLDDFETYEDKSTNDIDPCSFSEDPPAWSPQSGGAFVDSHAIIHPNCCNVCACYQESTASWTGRGGGAQMWLLDQNWNETCFDHALTYLNVRQ